MSEKVAPVLLRQVLQAARRVGADPLSLCRGLGFSESDLEAPRFVVSHVEAITVIRRALAAIDDPVLGLELGMHSNLAHRGVLALGLLASATPRDAIRLMLRFPGSAGLLVGLREETSPHRHALLATTLVDNLDVEPFLVDELFAGLIRLCRQTAGADYAPIAVELARDRPVDVGPYEAYFRSPVRFGSLHNRLVSDARWMDRPLPTADAMSVRYAEELLVAESSPASESAVGLAVARRLRQQLPQGTSSAELASSLHLSERTLRRRLMDSGLSYRVMQDEVRKSRALALVQNGTMDFATVALQTGFADISSFRRAFKRWTGKTPSEMRRRQS